MILDRVSKITIITATYNSERYLEETIKSVLRQTAYDRLEYIIVDGASTDRTLDIVNKYRDSIHMVVSEPDKGIYDAFNKGINKATGDAVYFLNSDDYLADDAVIQEVLDQFDSDLSIKAVYGNVLSVNDGNGFQKPVGRKTTVDDLQAGRMLPHQGLFVKKGVFDELGLFDLAYKIASDFDATIKLFKRYESNCVYIDRTIAIFRMGGASSDIASRGKLRNEYIQICEHQFGYSMLQPMSSGELNRYYYKKWVETLLLLDKPISKVLWDKRIRGVAIFGTVETSLYMCKDLQESGIKVFAFLDNDSKIQGMEIRGITVQPVNWLLDHESFVDAIILAFEGDYDTEIRKQVHDLLGEAAPQIISWKQIVEWNLE